MDVHRQPTLRIACAASGLALLLAAAEAQAVDIDGSVRNASGGTATVVSPSELVPRVGDKVEIFFKIPGTSDEISIATGRVTAVGADSIEVAIDKATGRIVGGQLARIHSDHPKKRAAAAPATPPAASKPAASKPAPGAAAPGPRASAAAQTLAFSRLAPGALAPNAFGRSGLRFVPGQGAPGVYAREPNMVLPKGRDRVLLVAGERVTSLTMTFDPPVRHFSLTRIGTAGGASVPTWTLRAFDRAGRIVASAGEEHGLPPQPRRVSLEGRAIVRVQLDTDNRWGGGTWATWNSLPVVELEIAR